MFMSLNSRRTGQLGSERKSTSKPLRKEDVVLLPAAHVQWQSDTSGVFVRQGDRATWRPLEFGLRSREAIEVIEGLQSDDMVVVPKDPRAKLADGKRIALP